MLVLLRQTNQRIMLSDGVIVTLLTAGGGRAKIGIQAPKEVKIVREELMGRDDKPSRHTTTSTREGGG